MKTRKFATRKPNLESLENRSMMAGNVNAYMSGGELYIVGDNAANHVSVQANTNGTVTVYGQIAAGDFTRINGKVNGSATFRITDDAFVYLYGGNDQVDFGTGNGITAKVADALVIDAGAGDDWVMLRQVQTGRSAFINTGTGKDTTYVGGSNMGANLYIYDPTAVNASDFDKITVNGTTVRNTLSIDTRGGNDRVEVTTSSMDKAFVTLGAGDDYLGFSLNNIRTSYSFDGGTGSNDTLFAPRNGRQSYRGYNFERVTNG